MTPRRLAVLVGALALSAACGFSDPDVGARTGADIGDTSGSRADETSGVEGELTVFAAASLTDAFTEIGRTVEATHPGLTVTFNFAGSQQLATQIVEGAPADVFAAADHAQMDVVAAADAVDGDPLVIARNRLAIVVEPGNPTAIAGPGDLTRADVTVVLAAEQVPAGRYARDLLQRAGVDVSPVSLETDVRAVLTKVALGEADAGIVYASDVVAADDRVQGVALPDDGRAVVADYPIAVLRDAPNPAAGRRFIDAVRSEVGQAVLVRHGFTAAP